jgi:hypothetical protein
MLTLIHLAPSMVSQLSGGLANPLLLGDQRSLDELASLAAEIQGSTVRRRFSRRWFSILRDSSGSSNLSKAASRSTATPFMLASLAN